MSGSGGVAPERSATAALAASSALDMSDSRRSVKNKAIRAIIDDALMEETTNNNTETKEALLQYICIADPQKRSHIEKLMVNKSEDNAKRKIRTYFKAQQFKEFVELQNKQQGDEDPTFQVAKGKKKKGHPGVQANTSPVRQTASASERGSSGPSGGKEFARGGTSRSRSGGSETNQWKTLEPDPMNQLIVQRSGSEAEKLDAEALPSEARGYIFVGLRNAAAMAVKYSKSPKAIAIIAPIDPGTKIQDIVQEHKKIFKNLQEAGDEMICPSVIAETLMVRDSATKKQESGGPRDVLIINVNENNVILPAHNRVMAPCLSEQSRARVMPNITIEKAATTTLSISIVQPICEEVEMQNWWNSVKNIEIKKLQNTIKEHSHKARVENT